MDLATLRRLAVTRSLFAPTTLDAALRTMGFVQADPIRAPARAQDLTLRHRVRDYRAGDLERQYPALPIEEDVFINYGFLPRDIHHAMHPRSGQAPWAAAGRPRVKALLAFIGERGAAHPRDVDDHFAHGSVTNYWGGSSNATTHMLDAMHYRGLLRVVRRDDGIRVYGVREQTPGAKTAVERRAVVDRLADLVVRKYAPLPARSLSYVIARLRYAVPQWSGELRPALARVKGRLAQAEADGTTWYWPADWDVDAGEVTDEVRLLTPFDPVVWDRHRFERLWGWAYRFEAYTPAKKRKFGYYALPLLWRDRVVGWANATTKDGTLDVEPGYVASRAPRERGFRQALDGEIERLRTFLAPRTKEAGQ